MTRLGTLLIVLLSMHSALMGQSELASRSHSVRQAELAGRSSFDPPRRVPVPGDPVGKWSSAAVRPHAPNQPVGDSDRPAGDRTLSSMVRQVAMTLSEEEIPRPTGTPFAAVQDRSDSSRFDRLINKPVNSIRIEAWPEGDGAPKNLAADYHRQSEIFVSASGVDIPLPSRYTIGFRHRPLYFEQPNLERCGRSFGYFQNVVSGAQFFANTVILPYHMKKDPPQCTVLTRGDCQCGQKFPCPCNPFPLDAPALITEAAAIAGFSLLVL